MSRATSECIKRLRVTVPLSALLNLAIPRSRAFYSSVIIQRVFYATGWISKVLPKKHRGLLRAASAIPLNHLAADFQS
jgi:hypothetical protein